MRRILTAALSVCLLAACDHTRADPPPVAPSHSVSPSPTAPAPSPSISTNGPVREVHPGAFCDDLGTTGKYRGRTYTCKGPEPYRWRR